MPTISVWQILFNLFVNTYCLSDWSLDTQPGGIATPEPLLGNVIENPFVALGTTNDEINSGANSLNSEISKAQSSSSDCAPDIKRFLGKKKARRDNICPADRLQFNDGEKGRQLLPTVPNGQQGGGGGGGQMPIRLIIHGDPLQYIFIPERNRPKENEEICPHIDYPVPVCAREVDAFSPGYSDTGDTILDPCHLCKIFKSVSHKTLFKFNAGAGEFAQTNLL